MFIPHSIDEIDNLKIIPHNVLAPVRSKIGLILTNSILENSRADFFEFFLKVLNKQVELSIEKNRSIININKEFIEALDL